VSDRCLMPTQ